MSEEPLFDVVAVSLKTGGERFLDERLTEKNAEAVIWFAIVRRGVDVEYYVKHEHPYALRSGKS